VADLKRSAKKIMQAKRVVEVDLVGVRKNEELHGRLATAFRFPPYYGKNWDAFWDCVTTLDSMPQKISIRGLKFMSAALPRDAAIFEKSLEDFRAIPEARALEFVIE
jgi:ribonuclease inhibitor